ncbi:flavin reductase family protein [Microbacterium sediminicola]|uniref:Flavin reductase family protein n=1 Tax=Microbacterium sediminicola TaxID=415210 RepID=A0ABN2HYU0_9MICO
MTVAIDLADAAALRRAFTLYPHGVMAVAAEVDGAPVGLAVSAFVSVSLEPPLVLLCFDKQSSTWPKLKDLDAIGVSVLARDHAWLAKQLASRSRDRFAGASFERVDSGALLLADTPTQMVCTIDQVLEGGDHLMVLMRVGECRVDADIEPLVWHDSRLLALGRGL